MNYDIGVIMLAFVLLSRVRGSLVFHSKEFVIVQLVAIMVVGVR